MWLEGFKVWGYVGKDGLFEMARHVAVLYVSKKTKTFHGKPIPHRGRMVLAPGPIEGRVANRMVGSIKVGAYKEEYIEY
jgi:hypothetical protein